MSKYFNSDKKMNFTKEKFAFSPGKIWESIKIKFEEKFERANLYVRLFLSNKYAVGVIFTSLYVLADIYTRLKTEPNVRSLNGNIGSLNSNSFRINLISLRVEGGKILDDFGNKYVMFVPVDAPGFEFSTVQVGGKVKRVTSVDLNGLNEKTFIAYSSGNLSDVRSIYGDYSFYRIF